MNIAVNTRFLLKEHLEGYGYFIQETLKHWCKDHPEHHFFFLFDRPFDPSFVFAPNVTPLVVTPQTRHPLLWKVWFDIKVPLMLRKIKADVFVSMDGFCSLATRIPQCLVLHDLAFLHHPEAIYQSHLNFYKRNTPKFLKKAKAIATVSEFSKADITRNYNVPDEKIAVVYNGIKPVFQQLSYNEQNEIKDQYTGGAEYFLYTGSIHPRKNLLNLLKAFSIFKRRLQSGMKLVLAGRLAWKSETFTELLQTYKFRDDVVLTGYLPEADLARLTASAYAMVYPSLFEGFGVPVMEAAQCGVPVLTSANSAMQEIAGEAALYFDPSRHENIADQMMRIYKDETLRSVLIEKGLETAKQYSWQRTADLLWKSVMNAVGSSTF